MTDKKWTEAETALLERLVGQQYSARQCADELGKTRNSVIGKCNRSGFKLAGGEVHRDISKDDALLITKLLSTTPFRQDSIADVLGVSPCMISHINNGRSYTDITGASSERPLRGSREQDRERIRAFIEATQGEE